jgi:hypothetical protein
MKRFALIVMVAVATLLGASALGPSSIAVAQYARTPVISTNVPTVAPGGTFTVTVGDCLPGETVVITFQGVSIAVTCSSSTVQASASFAAPSAPRIYDVCGVTNGSTTVCTTIRVIGAGATVPATVPGSGLPATGSSGLGTTATSAIVLISAGVLLLIVSQVRRRRTAVTTVTA